MNISATNITAYQAGAAYGTSRSNNAFAGIRAGSQTQQPGTQGQPLSDPSSGTRENAQQESGAVSSGSNTENTTARTELNREEQQLVDQLKEIDTAVRSHEMAHVAAGGGLVRSGASFTYQKGPDGQNYAVAGEVSIDTSPVPGDPQATIEKMQQVKNAALAPAEPSAQDIKVASQATTLAAKAASELMTLQAEQQAGRNETQAFGDMKNAADSYAKVQNLPEQDASTFQLAV